MGAVEIKPGIHWVGAIDWAVRDFHGYITPHGTSYNNYLILDKHVTLVDTVKHDFWEYTIDSIRGLVDPAKIENVVINHIENDHMTSIDRIMELAPKATIYITERGKKGLDRFYRHVDVDSSGSSRPAIRSTPARRRSPSSKRRCSTGRIP